ncbi:MAG: ion channel [Bacteroidota bacterium]
MNLTPSNKKSQKEAEDLGFGTKITGRHYRLLEKNGKYNVTTIGKKGWTLYQDLKEMPWHRFFGMVVLFFILVNTLFAILLLMTGIECLSGVEDKGIFLNFLEVWFFSVQTLTTVGYGSVSPVCISSNIIASINALTGLLAFALATGLFFARFSRPVAQFVFSKNIIIAPFAEPKTGLMFRLANRRDNKIINAEAKLVMSWVESQRGKEKVRRFYNLELQLDKVVMLPLSWTVVHPITKESPLFGLTREDLEGREVEIIVLIQAYDETYSNQVFANFSYTAHEILYGYKFALMYYPGEGGKTILDLEQIDEMEKVEGLYEELNGRS